MTPIYPESLLRQDLLGFPPYTMASVTTDDFARIIKLDANENAFGPSPRAHSPTISRTATPPADSTAKCRTK